MLQVFALFTEINRLFMFKAFMFFVTSCERFMEEIVIQLISGLKIGKENPQTGKCRMIHVDRLVTMYLMDPQCASMIHNMSVAEPRFPR